MLIDTSLSEFLQDLLYYGSPLLMLAGIAGFATCMVLWSLRR